MNNWNLTLGWQITVYMLVSILATVIICLLQYKIYSFTKIEVLNFLKPEKASLMLFQWGPALGFVITALIFSGIKFSLNINFDFLILKKIIIVIAVPLLLNSIVFFLCYIWGGSTNLSINISQQHFILALVTIFIGALGEEIGWRGFLQPLLETKYHPLIASIFVGILWGGWHIHYLRNGGTYFFSFVLFTVAVSVIIAWILRGTNYSIVLSTLFHAIINFTFFILLKDVIMNHRFMIILALVWGLAATVIAFKYANSSI